MIYVYAFYRKTFEIFFGCGNGGGGGGDGVEEVPE